MSFTTTVDVEKALIAIAHMRGITVSVLLHDMATALIDEKKAEFRLLAEAFGVDIKDI